jgi:hypothetical protein
MAGLLPISACDTRAILTRVLHQISAAPRPSYSITRVGVEHAVRRLIQTTDKQRSTTQELLDWLKVEHSINDSSQKLQAALELEKGVGFQGPEKGDLEAATTPCDQVEAVAHEPTFDLLTDLGLQSECHDSRPPENKSTNGTTSEDDCGDYGAFSSVEIIVDNAGTLSYNL